MKTHDSASEPVKKISVTQALPSEFKMSVRRSAGIHLLPVYEHCESDHIWRREQKDCLRRMRDVADLRTAEYRNGFLKTTIRTARLCSVQVPSPEDFFSKQFPFSESPYTKLRFYCDVPVCLFCHSSTQFTSVLQLKHGIGKGRMRSFFSG